VTHRDAAQSDVESARDVLRGLLPFQSLSAEALDALARASEEGDAAPGQTIYDPSAPATHLYVVVRGRVRLERPASADGVHAERAVGARELFGWHAMREASADTELAKAAGAVSLLRIDGRLVLEALAREPNGGAATIEALLAALSSPAERRTKRAEQEPHPRGAPAHRRPLAALRFYVVSLLRRPETYGKLLGYVLLFGGWYLAVDVLALPRFSKFPGIVQVGREWLSPDPVFGLSIHTSVYYDHIWASVRRIAIAFALATSLGVPVGLALGASTTFRHYVFPIFELLRPIPILAWVPLAIVVFSGSETPVVFLTFLASFFATALNTRLGVKSVDPRYILAARCLGASPWQAFWHVIVPGSLPYVLTGLQISVGVAWFSLAAAEMVSGQFGLGYLINTSYTMVQYPTIVIGMLTLGFVGFLTSALVRWVGERLMVWRARELALATP
jgi:NitT/TauT family transport system permease protein